MKKNKYIVKLVPLLIVLLVGCVFFVGKSSNKDSDLTKIMDIEEKARSIDKRKFVIDYDVKEMNPNSKEIIAVVFNTEREYNVGFIDEYGTVLTEPFIVGGTYNDSNIYRFYGDMFEDQNNDVFYDKSFNVITPSDEQMKAFKELSEDTAYIMTKKDTKIMLEIYKELYTNKFNQDSNVGVNEKGILIEFNDNNSIYSFIADKKGKIKFRLTSQMEYLESKELDFFHEPIKFPEKGSIVGKAIIEGLGQVYFNLNGDIIWITYENY